MSARMTSSEFDLALKRWERHVFDALSDPKTHTHTCVYHGRPIFKRLSPYSSSDHSKRTVEEGFAFAKSFSQILNLVRRFRTSFSSDFTAEDYRSSLSWLFDVCTQIERLSSPHWRDWLTFSISNSPQSSSAIPLPLQPIYLEFLLAHTSHFRSHSPLHLHASFSIREEVSLSDRQLFFNEHPASDWQSPLVSEKIALFLFSAVDGNPVKIIEPRLFLYLDTVPVDWNCVASTLLRLFSRRGLMEDKIRTLEALYIELAERIPLTNGHIVLQLPEGKSIIGRTNSDVLAHFDETTWGVVECRALSVSALQDVKSQTRKRIAL
jgi:hypothetical protein